MARDVKIMIVEDDPGICECFCERLSQNKAFSLVFQTDSERAALDYLETHSVDVMILDLELTEGDGVSLLDQIESRDLEKPFIVVVTNTGSAVTLSYMRQHGADYIYQKTNASYSAARVISVIQKLYPYQQMEGTRKGSYTIEQFRYTKADDRTRQYIESELEKMGFKRRYVGFEYAVDMIHILINDKENKLQVTRDLYPLIAKRHHTTRDAVERGIRNAIEAVFVGVQPATLQHYYPFNYDEEKGRPTNVEFLKNMAIRLSV